MYSLKQFQHSRHSLLVYQNNKRIFSSKAAGLKPLLFFLRKPKHRQIVIYDQIVGAASALLLVLLKPKKVYTPILSIGGEKVLRQYKIAYEYQKKVKYIANYTKVKICHFEKMAVNKNPQQFIKLLAK